MKPIEWTPEADQAMGRRIAEARNAKGLSLRAVGESLGVVHATVGHWETGERSIKHHDLARLCSLLQISADELLFGVRRWPFTGIDFDLVNDLEPLDLGRLEGSLLSTALEFGIEIKRTGTGG